MNDHWTPERIRALRERHGLRQNTMADDLGLTPSRLCRLERGVSAPSRCQARLLDLWAQVHEPGEGKTEG